MNNQIRFKLSIHRLIFLFNIPLISYATCENVPIFNKSIYGVVILFANDPETNYEPSSNPDAYRIRGNGNVWKVENDRQQNYTPKNGPWAIASGESIVVNYTTTDGLSSGGIEISLYNNLEVLVSQYELFYSNRYKNGSSFHKCPKIKFMKKESGLDPDYTSSGPVLTIEN